MVTVVVHVIYEEFNCSFVLLEFLCLLSYYCGSILGKQQQFKKKTNNTLPYNHAVCLEKEVNIFKFTLHMCKSV